MKWNQIGKRLIPPFLRRKREEVPMAKGMDHLLYEFSINAENNKLDVDAIKKMILVNPWCMITNPSVVFNDNSDGRSITISFHVLKKEKGKEVEKMILEHLK